MRLVCPVLVGRERERALSLVSSLLRAAAEGAGSVAVVTGETGVGKTRLVNAEREAAERDGVAAAGGGCLEPFASQPYAPVAELLRDMLHERDAADARALLESVEPWLLRLLPELGGSAGDTAAVEEHERYRVARGVCSLIERRAGERPLVIVLEDLHWSDAATLELLPWLARRVRDCAVLVLATLRSDELGGGGRPSRGGRAVRRGGRRARSRTHAPGPLRAGDPQLHTHLLVANLGRGTDGRWSALDGRRLYAHARTSSFVYQAVLRSELTRTVGVQWSPVRKGVAEVVGVRRRVLAGFSRRRAEIEAALEQRGTSGARAAEAAALATRRPKDPAGVARELTGEWRTRAAELGLGRGEIALITG